MQFYDLYLIYWKTTFFNIGKYMLFALLHNVQKMGLLLVIFSYKQKKSELWYETHCANSSKQAAAVKSLSKLFDGCRQNNKQFLVQ